jgi:putative transposase
MPSDARPRRQSTDDWSQLRLLITSPEQETYELLRPIVLFGQSPAERARETRTPERTLRRKAARFDALGMRSLFDADILEPPTRSHRTLPAELERAIVELKAEYPVFGLREIARICRERFGRSVSHHSVGAVLAREAPQSPLPRRFRRYHEIADPVERRRAVVTLYLDGWSAKAIAGYLETSRRTVYDTLRRWDEEGWPGLADRPFGPRPAARKVDLKAMAAIRRLQANPELGEFRIHAALKQIGIDLSPRTCGRILALHRALGAPKPSGAVPHEPKSMPFAAERRHEFWSVDIRYVEDHALEAEKPVYVISVLDNFSRALLASVISPRQDLTAYLIVLRAAVEAHGAPEALVSDSGSVFKAKHAQAIYRTLGIRKVEIERRQPWQNYIETHFNIMRRLADHEYAKATTWTELRAAHARFFRDYNEQSHVAHRGRVDGRLSPAAVLGWVHGRWCDPADLDLIFRLRATRVLNRGGCLRFRHWRLSGERGLAGKQAAVWVHDETLTIEHAADMLAQYHIALEADGCRLRDVGELRLYVTSHASPQPFLPFIAELPWRPALRLAPYQPRQTSAASETQAFLFDEPRDALTRQTYGGR